MKQKYLSALISFCIGVAWVFSFTLGIYLFAYGISIGFLTAIFLFFLGISCGFIVVAFFEGISMIQDILVEKKRQTAILESILERVAKKECDNSEKVSDN